MDDARALTVRGLSAFRWWLVKRPAAVATAIALGYVLPVVAVGALGPVSAVVGFVLLVLAVVLAYLSKVELAFEDEGVVVRRYGLRRFLAYGDIARVEAVQRVGIGKSPEGRRSWMLLLAARIHLARGRSVDVPLFEVVKPRPHPILSVGTESELGVEDPAMARVLRRLAAGSRAARSTPSPHAAALARGARPLAEWKAAIAGGKGAPHDVYRTGDPDEGLWRVVEDDAAPRDARAAAAVALRARLGPEGRLRLRAVADDCPSPTLRVALDAAGDEHATDADLERALEGASRRRA